MARYFFNIHGARAEIDHEGVDFVSSRDACLEAIKFVGALLPEYADLLMRGQSWHLDVTDVEGLTLFRLDVQRNGMPAMPSDLMTQDDGRRST